MYDTIPFRDCVEQHKIAIFHFIDRQHVLRTCFSRKYTVIMNGYFTINHFSLSNYFQNFTGSFFMTFLYSRWLHNMGKSLDFSSRDFEKFSLLLLIPFYGTLKFEKSKIESTMDRNFAIFVKNWRFFILIIGFLSAEMSKMECKLMKDGGGAP